MSWQEPPQQGELVQYGNDLAHLQPTAHLKQTPWGELYQWWEATAPGPAGVIHTIGKWLPVAKR